MMNKYLLLVLLGLLMAACHHEVVTESNSLTISAEPLEGEFFIGEGRTFIKSPNTLQLEEYFVWGGSVIRGRDNQYHMLFSLWDCGEKEPPFQDGWLLNSKIAYAVSNYPDREFKFQKIVLRGRLFDGDSSAWDAQSVHNPHIKKFNGKYYLYYTGSCDPGQQPKGSPGENLSTRNRIQQNQKLGVIEFNSFEELLAGDFIRSDKPLLEPRTRVKDIDIYNPEEVEWAIATRFQATRDLTVLTNQIGSSLDPSSDLDTRHTSKMGLDATIPTQRQASDFMRPVVDTNLGVEDFV